MSIRVHCQCGHEFRIKDKYAGREGKCPNCLQRVRVPGPPPEPAPAASKSSLKSGAYERRHLARALARQLIPKSLPDQPTFEVGGRCFPAREPGNDYYDCLQLHDGSWAVLIATVNVHGFEAAQRSLQLRAATHALAMGYNDPGVILTLLNRMLIADWPENRSATMLLVRFEPQSRLLSYASAAHPTGYVLDVQGHVKWNLESADCSIGLLGHTMYGTGAPLLIDPGEAVVLFSAGLANAKASDGSPLGTPRLLQNLGAALRQPAAVMIDSLRPLLPKTHPPVDQTALILKVR